MHIETKRILLVLVFCFLYLPLCGTKGKWRMLDFSFFLFFSLAGLASTEVVNCFIASFLNLTSRAVT